MYQQNCYQIFEKYILRYNAFFDIFDNDGKDLKGSMFGTAFGGAKEPGPAPKGDVFISIPCNLQEFYCGALKKISYTRDVLQLDGRTIKN